MLSKKIIPQVMCFILLCFFSSGCSLSSYPTAEGLVGTLAGAGVGAGIGHLIGDRIGNKNKNMAISAGVGAVSGLAIGALIHDQRARFAEEEATVIREAKMIGDRQKEIDKLYEEVYSESSWGRLEVKPWHERYQIEVSEYPYQSPK
ncbi:MAG TPA: glycine zipper family protein [Oligoflexia bacterium]|nr:glycine zipper family protein [Oligoflexia bacterium]HMP49767.1 glycine zipper family protein [Oligoflexia bacterium]